MVFVDERERAVGVSLQVFLSEQGIYVRPILREADKLAEIIRRLVRNAAIHEHLLVRDIVDVRVVLCIDIGLEHIDVRLVCHIIEKRLIA